MNQPGRNEKLEIAHVLFMDVVGFGRLSLSRQTALMEELQEIVRACVEFQRAEAGGELLRLPTGDGMALVFFRDSAGPIRCAEEIARQLAERQNIPVRMGIHSGPVVRVTDINAQPNVAGGGINGAQRVMDCGDAGHILLSATAADFAVDVGAWNERLHDLGECEVKHGKRIHLFNLYGDEFGNPQRPGRAFELTPGGASQNQRAISPIEAVGGAVPLDSPFYVKRLADDQFEKAIARQDMIVLVKGPRQIGKTSLLARGLQTARSGGARVVRTDLQKLNSEQLASAESVYITLKRTISDQLNLKQVDGWDPGRGANENFERFLRREVLTESAAPLVWALDEVDRLFTREYASEVFGLFRSWHNERSLEPAGPFRRMSLTIAYATEAHLFITDLNQSPFNVGTRIDLPDFTLEQLTDLNRRHGEPLRSAPEIYRFCHLVGGHPFLVRRGLAEMVEQSIDVAELDRRAGYDDGPFGDHLRRLAFLVSRDSELNRAVSQILRKEGMPSPDAFYRLRSAGILAGHTTAEAAMRCSLYERYFLASL